MFKRKMMRFTPENTGSNTKRKSFIRKRFHDMSRTGRRGFFIAGRGCPAARGGSPKLAEARETA